MNSIFPLLHSDAWGPAPISGGTEFRYIALFVDDCTRMTWIYFLKNKSQVFEKFVQVFHMIQNQIHKNIQILRSDKEGLMEFIKTNMKQFL